jgi:N-acetylmuramoyl-L-alanine amidase
MNIITKNSPNFNSRPEGALIDAIILHYTGMQSLEAALERMCNAKHEVSAHYCIAVNGDIYQLVSDEMRAWHAGKSFWQGKESLNDNSIGIEIVNTGHEFGYKRFPDAQMQSVLGLLEKLFATHNIDKKRVLGHSDIAPDRKEDPGEFFNWQLLAKKGFSIWHGLEESFFETSSGIVSPGDSGESILQMQQKLKMFGYKVELTSQFDHQTKLAIIAFYRRFIPSRIIKNSNTRYPENIFWDNKAEKALDIILTQ